MKFIDPSPLRPSRRRCAQDHRTSQRLRTSAGRPRPAFSGGDHMHLGAGAQGWIGARVRRRSAPGQFSDICKIKALAFRPVDSGVEFGSAFTESDRSRRAPRRRSKDRAEWRRGTPLPLSLRRPGERRNCRAKCAPQVDRRSASGFKFRCGACEGLAIGRKGSTLRPRHTTAISTVPRREPAAPRRGSRWPSSIPSSRLPTPVLHRDRP